MKISNFRSETSNGRTRALATVQWEECDRPSQDLYFETEKEFGHDLACNPHAFLVACIVPAMHHGERRLSLDLPVCPELKSGLFTAMKLLCYWNHDSHYKVVEIEAKAANGVRRQKAGRAAMFFTGGIDSLACLRANRLVWPKSHTGYFKDAIMLYGQNIESDNNPATFASAVQSFEGLTQDAGITLIPIYTNVRFLDTDAHLFLHKLQSAFLASVAHALSPSISLGAIASSHDIPTLFPGWGSHPLLDPNYSSDDVRIRHDGNALSRFEKTRLIANWNQGLQNIRVCPNNWPGTNCGKCEKCLRTMLALLALGRLEKSSSFPRVGITKELLLEKLRLMEHSRYFYRELLAPLAQIGRDDLVDAIHRKLKEYNRTSRISHWREKVSQVDDKYLNGGLKRFKHLVRSRLAI